MRLDTLLESTDLTDNIIEFEYGDNFVIEGRLVGIKNDGIIVEFNEADHLMFLEDEEVLNEFIPLAIGAVGLGLSAYDAYQSYKQYKAGEITKTDLVKRVGMDAALTLATGGIGKVVAKGASMAHKGIKSMRTKIRGPGANNAAAAADNSADIAKQTTKHSDEIGDASKASKRAARRKAGRRARRGMDGFGGSSDVNYENPLQRAVQNITASESASVYVKDRLTGVESNTTVRHWSAKVK